MKKIFRGLSRLIFHIINMLIVPVELVSPRQYMRFYAWFLACYGINFAGVPRYISSRVRFDDFRLVTIGDRVVISKYVILLTHDYSVTTALIANGETPPSDVAVRRPITIGNNVFLGMSSIVLPGTFIEDNVIVGAGSVVRGRVESDTIVMGNPAITVGRLSADPERWRARSRGEGASMDNE